MEPTEATGTGLSRREALKRGVALGGAVLWATPVVQTVGMRQAFAQVSPPPGGKHDISYIAMNIVCFDGQGSTEHFIKWEDESGFEDDPGRAPFCDFFTPKGKKSNGEDLGFEVEGPEPNGCVTITVPDDCIVNESAVKGALECCEGATGTGELVFCRPDC